MRDYTLTIKRAANGHIVEHPDAFNHGIVVRVFESNKDMLDFLSANYFSVNAILRSELTETPAQPTDDPQEVDLEIETPDDPVYGRGANEPAYSEQFETVLGGDVIDATGDTDIFEPTPTAQTEPDYGPVAESTHTIHSDGSMTANTES